MNTIYKTSIIRINGKNIKSYKRICKCCNQEIKKTITNIKYIKKL